jgi:hypothetical protein
VLSTISCCLAIEQDELVSFTGLLGEQNETNAKMLLKYCANLSYYHFEISTNGFYYPSTFAK